eukprot:PLAT15268.4.p1 GENE.PLAT15268.4~~PLAT15268.4.p1  ORF type:complete len:759 (+),score=234.44 PLAT15268.4:43-2277(+)
MEEEPLLSGERLHKAPHARLVEEVHRLQRKVADLKLRNMRLKAQHLKGAAPLRSIMNEADARDFLKGRKMGLRWKGRIASRSPSPGLLLAPSASSPAVMASATGAGGSDAGAADDSMGMFAVDSVGMGEEALPSGHESKESPPAAPSKPVPAKLGDTQGASIFHFMPPDFAQLRLRHETSWSKAESVRKYMLRNTATFRSLVKKLERVEASSTMEPLRAYLHTIDNLVFEGGGLKAYSYISALEGLRSAGLRLRAYHDDSHVRRFAGASAGAITAALLAMDTPLEDLRFYLSRMNGVPMRDGHRCCSLVRLYRRKGAYPGAALKRFLRDTLRERWYFLKHPRRGPLSDDVPGGCCGCCAEPTVAPDAHHDSNDMLGGKERARLILAGDLDAVTAATEPHDEPLTQPVGFCGLLCCQRPKSQRQRVIDSMEDPTFEALYEYTKSDAVDRFGRPFQQGNFLLVVASNLSRQKPVYYSPQLSPKLPIYEAVMRSANLPVLWEPEEEKWLADGFSEKRDLLVDGGITVNYPLFAFDAKPQPERVGEPLYKPWKQRHNPANLRTLGFKLLIDDVEELSDEILREDFHLDVRTLPDFGKALLDFMQRAIERQYVKRRDWVRTLPVFVPNFPAFDTTLTASKSMFLLKAGMHAAFDFMKLKCVTATDDPTQRAAMLDTLLGTAGIGAKLQASLEPSLEGYFDGGKADIDTDGDGIADRDEVDDDAEAKSGTATEMSEEEALVEEELSGMIT